MKDKQKIWSLFDQLRPIIISKLLNPKDKYVLSGGTQLVVPLNAEEAENLTAEQQLTVLPPAFPNIWNVYPNEIIDLPWEDWEIYLIVSLKTDDMLKYRLMVSLTAYGCNDMVLHGQAVCDGSIEEITHYVGSGKFQDNASSVFNGCFKEINRKIEASGECSRKVRLFEKSDITDFDSVMKFVNSLKDSNVLSRTKAKETISMDEFRNSMSEVYSTSVCESTIDEAPQADKPMVSIVEAIVPTATIERIIRPIYNFKVKG